MATGFCYDINHNLAIDYVNGEVRIGSCCHSGRIMESSDTSLNDIWKNKTLIKIREANNNNVLDDHFCQNCLMAEKVNLKSRRLSVQEFYNSLDLNNKELLGLDIKLGNLCNLKCTICGPDFSTAWLADAKKLNLPIKDNFIYDKTKQFKIADTAKLKDLQIVKFWGGEPLIDKKHFEILKIFKDVGILQNLRIVYQTNGTHQVDKEVLELWKEAKLIEIYFSIDDIGKRFEYQRFGANWDEVESNLLWYKDNLPWNHLFYIQCTLSLMNICYVKYLEEWKEKKFNSNRLGDYTPIFYQMITGRLNVNRITTTAQEKIKQITPLHIHPFLDMFQIEENYYPDHFFHFLQQLDTIRNTNWKTTFPELNQIFNVNN